MIKLRAKRKAHGTGCVKDASSHYKKKKESEKGIMTVGREYINIETVLKQVKETESEFKELSDAQKMNNK